MTRWVSPSGPRRRRTSRRPPGPRPPRAVARHDVQVVGLGRGGEQRALQRLGQPGHGGRRGGRGLGGGDAGERLRGERAERADELPVGGPPVPVDPAPSGSEPITPVRRPQRHRAARPHPGPLPHADAAGELGGPRSPGRARSARGRARRSHHRQREVRRQPADGVHRAGVQRRVDQGGHRRAVVVGQAQDDAGGAQGGRGVPADHGQRGTDGLHPPQLLGDDDQAGHPGGVGELLLGGLAGVGDVGVGADHAHRRRPSSSTRPRPPPSAPRRRGAPRGTRRRAGRRPRSPRRGRPGTTGGRRGGWPGRCRRRCR